MGCSKNYNVLGGFYGYYSNIRLSESLHKLHNFIMSFLCNIYVSAEKKSVTHLSIRNLTLR